MDLQKLNILLALIIVCLIIYKRIMSNETFDQLDICDYDSPDPSRFCKSIKKGCTHLKHEQNNLNEQLNNNCTNLPTNPRDLINTAINCDDNVNKLLMNKYVEKEVCSQIKNFPDILPQEEIIPPSTYSDFPSVMENNQLYFLRTDNFANF